MDKLDKNKIDELLPRYCEGQVTEEERLLVETWMNESEENRRGVKQIHSLYLATDTIHVMKKVDTEKALSRVKGRITGRKKTMWWEWAQRAAAVLFIPLLALLGRRRTGTGTNVGSKDQSGNDHFINFIGWNGSLP